MMESKIKELNDKKRKEVIPQISIKHNIDHKDTPGYRKKKINEIETKQIELSSNTEISNKLLDEDINDENNEENLEESEDEYDSEDSEICI